MDRSLPDRQLDNVLLPVEPVTFEIVDGGSSRGVQKLITSDGYTYTVRRRNGDRTYWTCTIRNKKMKCPGSVKQYQDLFTPASVGHIHPQDPAAAKKVKNSKKAKEQAKDRVFELAAAIVERVMKEMTTDDDINLPRPDHLTRTANYHRRNRPDDPKDLQFDLDRDYIGDDFVLDDIKMDDSRHILLGTTNQLDLLGRATRWFIEGTFKIVKEPFYQLLTVNVFVRKGDNAKQVPIVYTLMLRRTRQDYSAVLTSPRNLLGNPSVEWFMLDYEAATWQAIREVFPSATIKGCVFHWSQRIYRKNQDVGLAKNYMERGNHHEFLRMVMSLPYLSTGQIRSAFVKLKERLPTEEGLLHAVIDYVERTWINGAVWRPENWCVFRETVRTNNDLEGWHRRINGRVGRANMAFYALVPLLKGEAETVDLQIRLVTDHLLTKIRRTENKTTHGRLVDAWDLYEEDKLTTSELLRRISHINGLSATTSTYREYDDEDM